MNNVFRKFSAFHDETGRLNVDGMNIISNDGSNKLNRSRKARVSYKVQRTINASLNAATSTRAVSSNPSLPLIKERILVIILLLHFLSLMLGSVLVLMLPLLVWLTPDLRIKKSLLKCNWTIRKRLPRCKMRLKKR